MSDIQNRVIACIAELLGMNWPDIKTDADLESSLGMDSLDKVELVMLLEDKLDVMIDDAEAETCKTVADVVALVERVAK